MPWTARYFDGQSAREHDVAVSLEGSELVFGVQGFNQHRWSLLHLHPVDAPTPGTPFRLSNDKYPGERLIVRDQDLIDRLLSLNPQLKGGYTVRHFGQVLGWTAAGLAALGAIGFVLLNVLPQFAAPFLPEAWRDKTGQQIEAAVVGSARHCNTADGTQALGAMIGNLANGNDLPPIAVKVYDLDIVNAFAVSGGHIIMTRALIEAADSPDEVAGVLAHEIGHVAKLHPEQQLLRLTGLQVLMSAFSGSSNTELVTNAAALATILKYSRGAEEEADAYARETMIAARIDPMAFRHFFEKLTKKEGSVAGSKDQPSALQRIGSILSTHPDTAERIKKIEPLPAGTVPIQSLSPQQWLALKTICKT